MHIRVYVGPSAIMLPRKFLNKIDFSYLSAAIKDRSFSVENKIITSLLTKRWPFGLDQLGAFSYGCILHKYNKPRVTPAITQSSFFVFFNWLALAIKVRYIPRKNVLAKLLNPRYHGNIYWTWTKVIYYY